MTQASQTGSTQCHASCVVLDEDGVLVRGASGSGKSALCLALLDRYGARGRHARLVGDDRIRLSLRHGRIVARPHPALDGLVEIRGTGPCRLAHSAEAAVLRLVVDLVDTLPRLPANGDGTTAILGLRLPVLTLEPRQPREYLIEQVLAALRQDRTGERRGSVSSQTHPAALVSIGPLGMWRLSGDHGMLMP